ncbi:MAG: sensor histidine kinase [Bacteroidota bacterium]
MIRKKYKVTYCMAISFAMLFISTSFGQSPFNYDSAINIAYSIGDTSKQAELNLRKGKDFFYNIGPKQAIGPYKEAYRLFSIIKDSAGMADALNGTGVMYQKLGQTDSALNCYIQLVTIAEKKDYEEVLGKGYVNMGILYQLKNEFDKATYYLDQSIKINKKYNNGLVALGQMNKGLVYYSKLDFDSTLIKYRQAHAIYIDLQNSKMLADLYNNFGNVYSSLSDLDSAEYYYNKSKEMYARRGDWYTFCQAYHNMAIVANDRGYYDEALLILDSCINLAIAYGNKELETLAYLNKYRAYYYKGDLQKALENYLLYDSLDKIFYYIKKDQFMADLEMNYQNEKKQAQIYALERDNLKKAKQNDIYLFTGIGFIGLSIFVFLLLRQRAAKDKIIARQRIQQLEEEKKLLAAKSLVEGQEEERKRIAREIHDGLGVLLSTTRMQFSTIAATSPEAKALIEKASKLLEQASNDARKISHNMMPGLLTKLGLYEAVTDLLEKLSETKRLEVYVDIPEALKRLSENKEIMIYRIIQELVNNTLKHAGAKNIRLQMQMQADQLEIIYSDDGKGFNFEEKLESKSIGLNSVRSRVNFVNGMMEVSSEPGMGASFTFMVPC